MIPQLKAKGYPAGLAAAIIAAAGALGPIIPPSLLMIIYAAIAEESVGKLFLAGIVPGLLIGAGLMVTIHIWNLRRGWEAPSGTKIDRREVQTSFKRALIPLGTPVVIVGGIVGGIFTATEAGVIAAVYALLAAYFYTRMSWVDIRRALIRSGLLSSLSLFIITMAAVFSWILAREGFPTMVAGAVTTFAGDDHLLGAAIIILVLLTLGFFIEVLALMIIFVPILAPLGPVLGYDPVHWGLLMVMTMNVGGITPPVGSNLFISASIAQCSLGAISKYAAPLVAVHAVVIFLVLILPGLATWIPRSVFD
jgi:C4-dicarboxylate transporter DctM subunit